MNRYLRVILLVTGLPLAVDQASAQEYQVVNLGTFSGQGSSDANAINDQIQITGSASVADGLFPKHAFMWHEGVLRSGHAWR